MNGRWSQTRSAHDGQVSEVWTFLLMPVGHRCVCRQRRVCVSSISNSACEVRDGCGPVVRCSLGPRELPALGCDAGLGAAIGSRCAPWAIHPAACLCAAGRSRTRSRVCGYAAWTEGCRHLSSRAASEMRDGRGIMLSKVLRESSIMTDGDDIHERGQGPFRWLAAAPGVVTSIGGRPSHHSLCRGHEHHFLPADTHTTYLCTTWVSGRVLLRLPAGARPPVVARRTCVWCGVLVLVVPSLLL